jgi:integrase
VAPEKQTLRQFLDSWLEESVKASVSPATYQQYHQHSRLYFGPSLGKHELSKLSPEHIQGFINERLKSGLSPRTVQLSLVILRHALDQAMKWDLVPRNVAKLVDSPKVRRLEMAVLDPEQARRFLEAARGERLEALYSVALSLGLREGEALALRWIDVDFDGRQLSVRRTCSDWEEGDLAAAASSCSKSRNRPEPSNALHAGSDRPFSPAASGRTGGQSLLKLTRKRCR